MSIEQWQKEIEGCFSGEREADLHLLEGAISSSWHEPEGKEIRRAVLRLLPGLLTEEELCDLRGTVE